MKPSKYLPFWDWVSLIIAVVAGITILMPRAEAAETPPSWAWARVIGGTAYTESFDIAVSRDGTIFTGARMYEGVLGNSVYSSGGRHILGIFGQAGENVASIMVFEAANYSYSESHLNLTPQGEINNYASFTADDLPLLRAKYQRDGRLVFRKTADKPRGGGSTETVVKDIDTDQHGGVVMIGNFRSVNIGGTQHASLTGNDDDCFVIAFDPNGNLRWLKKVSGDNSESGLTVAINKFDNSVYVGGLLWSKLAAYGANILTNYNSGVGPFLVKFSGDGGALWSAPQEAFSAGFTRIVSLSVAPDGTIVFLGVQAYSDNEPVPFYIGKLTDLGQLVWVKPAGTAIVTTGPTSGPYVKVAPTGEIYVAATTRNNFVLGGISYPSRGLNDVVVAKFNSDGEPRWVKTAGFIGDDRATSLWVAENGEVFVGGVFMQQARFDDQLLMGNFPRSFFIAKLPASDDSLPTINHQPISQTAAIGEPITFQVSVRNGVDATFQWFFNGRLIQGATASSYNIGSTTAAHEGSYHVEITNPVGKVRSRSAELVIRGLTEISVVTIAGGSGPGYMDSADGKQVKFFRPNGIAHFSQGVLAVADAWNHLIRLVEPGGATDTFAGQNRPGLENGPSRAALFNAPISVAVQDSMDILAADFGNNAIRRVSAFGLRMVSTVAGGQNGHADGPALTARFNGPNDLVTDGQGNIFVTEFNNHVIRKISPNGAVTTFAGNGSPGSRDGQGTTAQFEQPGGLTIDKDGHLFVTESGGHRIRRVSAQGLVTTIAGWTGPGFADGRGSAARFNIPDGITIDGFGNLYVSEAGNHAIRKIDSSGNVTTIAGLGRAGFQDGRRETALFNTPGGLMWHPSGSLYVADTENHAIRRIEFIRAQSPGEAAELYITLNPTLTLFAQSGVRYRIEAAEADSNPPDWTVVGFLTPTNGTATWCDPQPAVRTKRLYRAVRSN